MVCLSLKISHGECVIRVKDIGNSSLNQMLHYFNYNYVNFVKIEASTRLNVFQLYTKHIWVLSREEIGEI